MSIDDDDVTVESEDSSSSSEGSRVKGYKIVKDPKLREHARKMANKAAEKKA